MSPAANTPPFGLTDSQLEEVARTCVHLICDGAGWIDRRKEAVTLVDEKTLRRRMSVDIAITDRLPLVGSDYLAPLFLLEKGRAQSTRFDFEDETGTSLTLPTRETNARVSKAVLQIAARDVLGANLPTSLGNSLAVIAEADPVDAEDMLDQLLLRPTDKPTDPTVKKLHADPSFPWLAETLASSSILIVPLRAEPGQRKIVKLAFDQTIDDPTRGARRRPLLRAGWWGYSFVVDQPFVGASTHHFEVHVPPGVELTRARLRLLAADGRRGEIAVRGPQRNMHLYVPEAADARTAVAALDLRLGRAGFTTGAVVAAAVVLTVLGLFVAFAGEIGRGSGSAPSLLLALPGAIATYVLRVEEGTVSSRLLVWARAFLLVSGLAAFGAALRLGITPPSADDPVSACALRWTWVPLMVLAGLAFVFLLMTRLMPRAPKV